MFMLLQSLTINAAEHVCATVIMKHNCILLREHRNGAMFLMYMLINAHT